MANQLRLINDNSKTIAYGLGTVVGALEALVTQYSQTNPTAQGLNLFWQESANLIRGSEMVAARQIEESIHALERTLSVSERAFYFSHRNDDKTLEIAHAAIGAFLEQSRQAFVQRLRGIVAARSFGMRTKFADPVIMDRAGRRRQFSEFAYLTVRQTLMNWLNNTKIAYCQSSGFKQFWVQDDETEVIAVYDVKRYPELVDELFHPRAQRIVGGGNVST